MKLSMEMVSWVCALAHSTPMGSDSRLLSCTSELLFIHPDPTPSIILEALSGFPPQICLLLPWENILAPPLLEIFFFCQLQVLLSYEPQNIYHHSVHNTNEMEAGSKC